jgi:DNA mismatch repair protein MLH1
MEAEPQEGAEPEANQRRQATFEEAQQLTSVVELKSAVVCASDAKLSERLRQSVYVGPATHELALIQCGPSLCLVNLARVAQECAYQRLLRLLGGGTGRIALKDPLPLKELLKLGVLDPGSGYDPDLHAHVHIDALVTRFADLLEERAELLEAYFMLDVADGVLRSLPNALGVASGDGLRFDGLPLFLVRLCAETNWDEEKPCLDGLCRVVANFCTEALLSPEESFAEAEAAREALTDERSAAADELNAAVEAGDFEDVAAAARQRKRPRIGAAGPDREALQEHKWLHEAIRRDGACQWPATFARDGTVQDLVSLDQLYRIFERC